MFHTTAWVIWLCGGLAVALTTTNPLYLILLAGTAATNYGILGRRAPLRAAWQPLLKVGLAVVVLATCFNLLFVHEGETVLFVLPKWQWLVGPDHRVALVTIGGPVALEAVIYGLTRTVGLMAVLLMFATFNLLVDTSHLMRSLSKFMYQTGVVTSIAISFVPQTVLALKEIREAQLVRGHRFRGIRDLLPLFIPMLTIGLERAMQLSESMEARGFGTGRPATPKEDLACKLAVTLALILLIVAAVLWGYMRAFRHIAFLTAGLAGILLLLVFRALGKRVQRSRYLRQIWRPRDTLLTGLSVVSLLIVWVVNRFDVSFLAYYPYPRLQPPGFNGVVGVAILLFVGPVFLLPGQKNGRSIADDRL